MRWERLRCGMELSRRRFGSTGWCSGAPDHHQGKVGPEETDSEKERRDGVYTEDEDMKRA